MQDLATSLLAHKGIRAGISGFKLASGASRVQKRNDDLEPREHDLSSLVIMSWFTIPHSSCLAGISAEVFDSLAWKALPMSSQGFFKQQAAQGQGVKQRSVNISRSEICKITPCRPRSSSSPWGLVFGRRFVRALGLDGVTLLRDQLWSILNNVLWARQGGGKSLICPFESFHQATLSPGGATAFPVAIWLSLYSWKLLHEIQHWKGSITK